MKKIFLPLLLMIFMLIAGGCSMGGDEESDKKIVVGLDDEYAPFSFRNERGELIGFDIDLAKEVARRMNVDVEFKGIPWDTKYDELESGKIDIIWSGFNITPERKEHVIFSRPYMENRQVIIVAKGNDLEIISVADLAGKIVGTQLSSPAEYFINQEAILRDSFAQFVTYDNYKHVFESLAAGELDAVICDELVARYEMNRHQDIFEAIEATIGYTTEVAIGFRKDDTALRDKVQEVLDEMIRDGTAEEISEQWFHADLIKQKR